MTPELENNILTWSALTRAAIESGESLGSRCGPVREVIGTCSKWNMSHPMMCLVARKLNVKFMVAEAMALLVGSNSLKMVTPYCKTIEQYSDDGYTLRGAYGPKFADQAEYVIDTLYEDAMSRQALMTFWRECPRKSKNIPCTISLQFIIREGNLNLIAHMRSNDLWLGTPYDVFCFSHCAAYILAGLRHRGSHEGVGIGKLMLMVGSHHIYEENVEAAVKLFKHSPNDVHMEYELPDQRHPHDVIGYLRLLL